MRFLGDRIAIEFQVGFPSHRLEPFDGAATFVDDEVAMVLLVHGKEFVDGDLKRR